MDYVVVAIVLLLLPVVIARPFFGAILYTVLAYLRPHNLAAGIALDFRLSLLVLVATTLGVGIAWFRGKEKPEVRTAWFAFAIAMTGTLWLATRTAVFPLLAWDSWTGFVQTLAGVAMTLALCTTLARVRIIALTAALSLGTMAVVALVSPEWDAGRLIGGGGNYRDSNDFALALCMVLPMFLCAWRTAERSFVRVLMLGMIPVVLVAIVLTQSRGGFLALGVTLGAWALFTRGRVFKIALAPAAVLLFLALAPATTLDRITSIQKYSHDSSARDRLSSWKVAWRIAEDRPLTGVGPGNFIAVYDRYTNDFRAPHVAHNTPLQILANAGIPALAVFLALLTYGVVTAARLASRARTRRRHATTDEARASLDQVDAIGTGIALALIAYAVGSQFLTRDDLDLFYLLAGLAAALAFQTRGMLARAPKPAPVIRGRVLTEATVPCTSVH